MSSPTVAAVSASISTPVAALVRAVASSRRPLPSALGSIATSSDARAIGWQRGISSQVRLAAWMAAMRATASTSPLAAWPLSTALSTAGAMLINPSATARRSVAGRSPTSTMCTWPRPSRCEKPGSAMGPGVVCSRQHGEAQCESARASAGLTSPSARPLAPLAPFHLSLRLSHPAQ